MFAPSDGSSKGGEGLSPMQATGWRNDQEGLSMFIGWLFDLEVWLVEAHLGLRHAL